MIKRQEINLNFLKEAEPAQNPFKGMSDATKERMDRADRAKAEMDKRARDIRFG